MSEIYDMRLLAGPLVVTCPGCGGRAVFDTDHGFALPVHLQRADGTVERDSWQGRMSCLHCGRNGGHRLDWPGDAWFRVEHRGNVLWAKDADMMTEIRRFIAAEADRKAQRRDSPYGPYLMRIPSFFLNAGHRDALLKKIDSVMAR